MFSDDGLFEEILRLFGLEQETEAEVGGLQGQLQGEIERIVGELSGVDEEAGGLFQEWLDGLLERPWSVEGLSQRAEFGRRFASLPAAESQLVRAIAKVRAALIDGSFLDGPPPQKLQARLRVINRSLDLELASVLHGYGEGGAQRAEEAGRLAALAELAASVGHELRNPLGVIDSTVFLLRKRVGADAVLLPHLDRIEGQIRTSSRIIDDMLAVARDRPPHLEQVALWSVVPEAAEAVLLRPKITLRLDVSTSLPSVLVDRSQLRQVLVNLITNASDSISDVGEIVISGRMRDPGFVELSVSDDGEGIDPAVVPQLFEPLFSTKAKGIGLGLSLSKRLIERMGGEIELREGPLVGATFVVRLPSAGETL